MQDELNKLNKLTGDIARARFQIISSMNEFFRDFKLDICLSDLTPDEMSHGNDVIDKLKAGNTTTFYLIYDENIMVGERNHSAVKFVENNRMSVMINWANLSTHIKFEQGLTVPRIPLDVFKTKMTSLFLGG